MASNYVDPGVEQLAAGRRKRRVDAVPAALRPAVVSFAESLLTARVRARRAGTLPRSDRTIDVALATVRDLALFLNHERGKQDWSTVDVADIEEFLNLQPNNRPRRLTVLRQFFRYARTRHVVLINPTRGLARKQPQVISRQNDHHRPATPTVSPLDHRSHGPSP